MNPTTFLVISLLYVSSLAAVDGLFNRLVFRNRRKLSYFIHHKQVIYKQWEWRAIGLILLIFLPIILPTITAFIVGGVLFVKYYWVVLLLVPWDMIFGALVFDDWFGDKPSIALPFFGWIHFKLWPVVIIRMSIVLLLVLNLLSRNK